MSASEFGLILTTRPIELPKGNSEQARVERRRLVEQATETQRRLKREFYARLRRRRRP